MDTSLDDAHGHGTHIAGIIGGTGAASNGYLRGLAPESELIILKVASKLRGPESNSIAAIQAALAAKVDIINFSNGTSCGRGEPPWIWPEELNELERAFEVVAEQGILCVVAAGNAGPNEGSVTRPGGLSSVLTVGAVDAASRALATSGRGPFRRSLHLRGATRYCRETDRDVRLIAKPDVVAPGRVTAPRAKNCELPDPNDRENVDPEYLEMSGSSQATAVISGIAASLLQIADSQNIDLGNNRGRSLQRLITHAASPLSGSSETEVGKGIVLWPKLVAVLEDFQRDAGFRNVILDGGPLRLIP